MTAPEPQARRGDMGRVRGFLLAHPIRVVVAGVLATVACAATFGWNAGYIHRTRELAARPAAAAPTGADALDVSGVRTRRIELWIGAALAGGVFLGLVWIGLLRLIQEKLQENAAAAAERHALEAHIENAQRLESLSILAGGIAHDFNNLLTGILTNAGTARRMLATSDTAQRHLSEIIQGSKIAGHLTGQLLAYAGKGQFEVRPRDLSAEVRDIEDLLETSVRHQARLSLDLADDLPAVLVDPAQLQQVLLNLVINAAESNEGEVEVHVRTRVVDLDEADVRTLAPGSDLGPGRCVVLEVQDTGLGIDDQTLQRVFDPFFTTKSSAGRGLGLAATLGIAHRHGGGIQVTSRPGQGTRFQVAFPASDEIVRPPKEEPATDLSGHGVVLLVDDDEYILRAVYLALESYGYSVLPASGGEKAVEIFSQRCDDIDLVLLDMSMPGMNGEETFRAIRAIRPDACVLLSTGYAPDEVPRHFTATGIAGFIRKPYDPDALAAEVKRLIGPGIEAERDPSLATALRDVRSAYRERLPKQLMELAEAMRTARDGGGEPALEAARRLSHRMAGTAGSYGLDRIHDALERIDTGLRELAEGTDTTRPWEAIDAALSQAWGYLGSEAD